MSGCNIFFDDDRCGKVMQRPVEGTCSICNPQEEVNRAEDACVCPPLGEPRLLTVAAPVVFDECGINLCKVLQSDSLNRFDDVDSVQLRVVDIDFNIQKNNEGSRVEFIEDRPNCVRVYLSNICVKLAVKLLDDDCNIIDEFCIDQLFLPDSSDPEYDEQTNPSFIIVDLYAPYGVSYKDCYGDCEPTINYIGFLESINNAIRQGIGAQALAKVVRFDPRRGLLAVGLTIYLKVIYFIQYRIPHEGLCCIKGGTLFIDIVLNLYILLLSIHGKVFNKRSGYFKFLIYI